MFLPNVGNNLQGSEYLNIFNQRLAECSQCYCREIRQMLTFLINLYCLESYHKPDHLIRIFEITGKIIPKRNILTGTRNQSRFCILDIFPVISSPKQTNLATAPFIYLV
jgi:hypothetical protein